MSLFPRPSSGGSSGGIDPAQLAALVDDNEAAALAAGLLSAADATNMYGGIVNTVHSRADMLSTAVDNARVAILDNMPQLPTGTVQLIANATGTAPANHERLSGITVTTGLFATARTVLTPMRVDANNPGGGNWGSGFLQGYNLAIATNGKAYLLDGTSAVSGKTFRAFNLGTMAWEVLQGHPGAPSIGAMVVNHANTAVYTFAGGTASISLTNHKYTLSNDTWTALPNRAISTSEPICLPRSDNKFLVAGGSNAATHTAASMLNTSHVFDEAGLAWSAAPNAPFTGVAKPYAAASLGGDKFLVYCRTSDGTTITTGVYVVDALTNGWTAADALPAGYTLGTSSSTFSPVSTNKALVVCSGSPSGLSRGLVYDISAAAGSRWQPYDIGDGSQSAPLLPRIGSIGGSYGAYAVMWQQMGSGYYTLGATYTGGTSLTVSQSFYARKTS